MGRFEVTLRTCFAALAMSLAAFGTSACTTTAGSKQDESSSSSPKDAPRNLQSYALTACRVFTGTTQSVRAMLAQPLTAEVDFDVDVTGAVTANPDLNNCRVKNLEETSDADCNAPAPASAVRHCVITCDVAIETAWLDTPRFNMTFRRMSDGDVLADCKTKEPTTSAVAVEAAPKLRTVGAPHVDERSGSQPAH